jgi:hypothetical protein
MIKQVVRGGPGKDENYREFIMTAASDAQNLPNSQSGTEQKTTAGSVAYLQDMSKTYLLGPDDVWREV